jgi:hypothetical protein
MQLVLLTVPDCPNVAAFEERLAAALAGHPAAVRRRVVGDEREAAETGMRGSPTLLVDGSDPFAAPGEPPSLSCRLYRDASGRTGPVPSVEELRRVLATAGDAEPRRPDLQALRGARPGKRSTRATRPGSRHPAG